MKSVKGFNGVQKIRVSEETFRDIIIEEIPSTMIGYKALLKISINELVFIFGTIEPCRRFARVYESLPWADKKKFQYCIPFSVHQRGSRKWSFLLYGSSKKDRYFKVLGEEQTDGTLAAISSFEGITADQFVGLMIHIVES